MTRSRTVRPIPPTRKSKLPRSNEPEPSWPVSRVDRRSEDVTETGLVVRDACGQMETASILRSSIPCPRPKAQQLRDIRPTTITDRPLSRINRNPQKDPDRQETCLWDNSNPSSKWKIQSSIHRHPAREWTTRRAPHSCSIPTSGTGIFCPDQVCHGLPVILPNRTRGACRNQQIRAWVITAITLASRPANRFQRQKACQIKLVSTSGPSYSLRKCSLRMADNRQLLRSHHRLCLNRGNHRLQICNRIILRYSTISLRTSHLLIHSIQPSMLYRLSCRMARANVGGNTGYRISGKSGSIYSSTLNSTHS